MPVSASRLANAQRGVWSMCVCGGGGGRKYGWEEREKGLTHMGVGEAFDLCRSTHTCDMGAAEGEGTQQRGRRRRRRAPRDHRNPDL